VTSRLNLFSNAPGPGFPLERVVIGKHYYYLQTEKNYLYTQRLLNHQNACDGKIQETIELTSVEGQKGK
jgi:hypothetical protein